MKNLFKSSLVAALAVAMGMFVSCSKDSTGGEDPYLTLSPESGVVQLCGGTVSTQVDSNTEWNLSISENGSDITPSQTSGKGSGYVSFDVPEVSTKRTVIVTFTYSGEFDGIPVPLRARFTIEQSNGGYSIYYEKCGTEVAKESTGYWPYVDSFTGWSREGAEGFDQSGVTYTGKSSSVRNSGSGWEPVAETDASGAPYVYMSKSDNTFEIQNIVIDQTEKNYTIGFTAFDTYASLNVSPYTPAYVTPSNDNLKLQVSVDGTKWGTVKFEVVPTAIGNGWYLASAPFKLPEFSNVLYIRFSNFVADTTTELPSSDYQYQASMRIDDFQVNTGGQGPEVVWEEDPTPTTKTVAEVKAAGAGQYIVSGTVVATSNTGFILGDATGAIYAYKKSHGLSVGNKVKVSGSYEYYSASKCWEFNSPEVTTDSSAPSYTYAPVEKDGPAIETLHAGDATAQECKFSGVAVVGTYVNFTLDGTTVQGGLMGVTASDYSQYNGQTVTVKGFLVANTTNSSGSFCNFIQYEITGDPSAPQLTISPASLTFESTGGTQTITATTNGLAGFTLSATSDNPAFSTSVSGNTISVTTSSTTTAQQGTLTVTYSNGTKSATKTATLRQKAPSSGGEQTITMTYTDILNGKTGTVDLSSNGYGSMDVTNPSTWYTWTATADFTGCKICKGNGTESKDQYKYNVIQMQGSKTETAKMGFLMNTSSLGKIKNIKITVKNNKNTNKPGYEMHFGTTQNPTESSPAVATGATVTGTESPFYFTDEFTPTSDCGYFRIYNNSGYAVYFDTIEITYEEQ